MRPCPPDATSVNNTRFRTDPGSLATALINSNLVALALTDHDRLVFANAAFRGLFGRHDGSADQSILDLLLPRHRQWVAAALTAENGIPPLILAEASRGDTTTFEVELRFERMTIEGETLIAVFAQEVEDHFRSETRHKPLAGSDPKTGLGNRAMFADRLRHTVLTTRGSARSHALLLLDLDGFRQINDRYGYAAGDLVLRRIADRLLASLRDTDTIVRLGGDAFAILVPNVIARTEAMTTADLLIELARQPVQIGQFEVRVGGSVGIAICPEHAGTADGLFAAADLALLAAKRRGRGCAVWASTASAAEMMPAPLIWSTAHETGLREIDEQHTTLMSLLNALVGAPRDETDHAAALDELLRYTMFHFATEERLMRTWCYGGAAAHHDLHRRLLDDLRDLRLDGTKMSIGLIARYLREWLLRHIDGADRDLANACLAAGAG